MKRYKVHYFLGDRSKPSCLLQISKTEKWDGARICFYRDGEKYWQFKCKNDLLNGIYKIWRWDGIKNNVLQNYKKGNLQGIEIIFKK